MLRLSDFVEMYDGTPTLEQSADAARTIFQPWFTNPRFVGRILSSTLGSPYSMMCFHGTSLDDTCRDCLIDFAAALPQQRAAS